MWIKIISFIFIFIILLLYSHHLLFIKIEIGHSIEDIPLLLDNRIDCIHIKKFYPTEYCDILLKQIRNIQTANIKPWRYSKDKVHDVSIFQIPLSDVFNELRTPEEYFNQKEWNLYDGIISPIDYFIRASTINNIHKGMDDCIIEHFPKYKEYNSRFLESIIRIYKPNSYAKEGLKHIDIDDTGYYNDYNIYSINIYLYVPKDGGDLTIQNKKVKPSKGDLILFNPNYYHSVSQSMTEDRISVQSFILSSKKGKVLYIRV
jgi:hypothetical protein